MMLWWSLYIKKNQKLRQNIFFFNKVYQIKQIPEWNVFKLSFTFKYFYV